MGSVVLVMSGHRSGSTMTAKILSELGVDMNPTSGDGTWEDKELQLLHEEAIGDWLNPYPEFDTVAVRYERYIKTRVRTSQLWGYKDPRICWLLNDIVGVLELQLNQHVYLINLYRHLVSSTKSLAIANPGMIEGDARHITEIYHTARQRALKNYRGLRLDLNYDQMIENPAEQVVRIANFLDVPATEGAIALIDPKKRHHK